MTSDFNCSYVCSCEKPEKISSTGCPSCWTCGICNKFGGCDNMASKFSEESEKIWGKNKLPQQPNHINFEFDDGSYYL